MKSPKKVKKFSYFDLYYNESKATLILKLLIDETKYIDLICHVVWDDVLDFF